MKGNSTMQALEMEEVESLMDETNGNGNGRSPVGEAKNPEGDRRRSAVINWRTIFLALSIGAVLFIVHSVTSKVEEGYANVDANSQPGNAAPVTPATTPSSSTGTNKVPSTPAASTPPKVVTGKAKSYKELSTIIPDPEHVPVDEDTQKKLATEWGRWHFWDGDEGTRPTGDYCGAYPNRDIPGDEFPDESWQNDAVFVNHIINDAEQLVSRAMEAIFVEYGHGKPLKAEQLAERMKMFKWDKLDLKTQTSPPPKFSKRGDRGNGGWTTPRSLDGLVRRLLHAIMTNDTFTVVMGGHSAAAGHGNHFHQSYMMQFHKIMAPIFARLGVKLITKNMAQGGLGTIHNALGSGSLYGNEIDLLLWDSGMTEPNPGHQDLFLRQGLLGGNRVPVVWGGNFNILRALHEEADVDVGDFGSGTDGVIPVEDEEQAKTVPFASRYMKCSKGRQDLCTAEPRFCAKCWVQREDLDPKKMGFKQPFGNFGGQVKWHPGWRVHQLTGRTIAFAVLQALQEAIQIFSDGTMGGPPLDEEYWHVTKYYENIRSKVKNLPESVGGCHEVMLDKLPSRVCNTALKARSLHTPRANPSETSIVNLLRPAPDGYVPRNEAEIAYEGPDVHNSCYDVHDIDVLAVIAGRRRLDGLQSREPFSEWDEWNEPEAVMFHEQKVTNSTPSQLTTGLDIPSRQLGGNGIVPGKGWQVIEEPAGICDGEYDSICGREITSNCPLRGHHDGRGFLGGTEYSGWVVMDIPDMKEGILLLKFWHWIKAEQVTRTDGWTTVNNERRMLRSAALSNQTFSTNGFDDEYEYLDSESLPNERRRLDLPDGFLFDYAINGKITTLNKDQFMEKLKSIQRVVDIITLLDDPNFTKAPKNVEVAFRIRECGRECTLALTHVYWA